MRNFRGRTPESGVQRFLLGAGIGIAISVPLFPGIEDGSVRIVFMVAFAGITGTGQVIAGDRSARSRAAMKWLFVAGMVSLVAGLAAFFLVN